MHRLSLGLAFGLFVIGSGCGARPDLLEDQEGTGAGVGTGGSATGGSATGGSAQGGAAQGGSAQGGSAQGGSAQGGSAQGGSAQGGSAQGGSAQGGSAQGGSAQGGSAQGGSAQGGSAQGGSAQGGSPDGGGGIGGTGGSASTGTSMICPSLGDKCTSCLSTGCAERYCNCYENKDCFGLFQCAGGCNGDMVCMNDCYKEHASGFSAASLLTDCAGTTCAGACPGNGGGTLDPCNECILETCDKQMNACVGDGNCLQLYQCLTSCPQLDLTCQNKCYETYPGSIQVLQDLLQCTQKSCSNPCQQ